MRKRVFFIGLTLSVPAIAQAYNLDEITRMADAICGHTVTSGYSKSESITYERDSIPQELLEDIKRELGDHFDNIELSEESLTVSNSSFSGVNQEDLAEHNASVRKCRKEVSMAAIKNQMSKR
ncbi:hypothetical protein BC355_08820 [Vibrio cholerae]|uniref:Uncharacterized protein n=1 Tax=Vibrio cholerae TaxID=666 RepID=A0A395U148_VIBCL|nr:hypothetical protein [Vibrio cholerae]RGP89813.1 hypothetical protein BC353_09630 [Vibrio cholerae]RGP89997.1 hypothetical protein BC355_08820 [Vibrio cholerae]RGP90720.1 hypothetical protein BC354_08015 [Vibrio cholerae]